MQKFILLLIYILFINRNSVCKAETIFEDPFNTAKISTNIINKNTNNCDNLDLIKELDLSELINIAMCKNPKIRQGWESFLQNQAKVGTGYSQYLPKVTVSSGYSRLNYALQGLSFGPNFPTSGNGNMLQNNVTLEYLLYDFGARNANLDSLKTNLISIGYNYNSTVQDIVSSVIEKYYTYFSYKELLISKIKAEELAKLSYEYSKARHKAGVSKKLDELQSNASYSNIKYERANVEKKLEVLKADLLISIGLSPNVNNEIKIFTPKENIKIQDIQNINKDINELIKIARENNLKLKSANANLSTIKAKMEQIKYDAYPKIALTGGVNRMDMLNTGSMNHFSIQQNTIGVTVSIPLFAGFQNVYINKANKHEYKSAVANIESMENDLIIQVLQNQNNFELSIQNLTLTNNLLEAAIEAENNAREGYKYGANSILDVLSAQSTLTMAEEKAISAKYNVHLTRINLLKSLGVIINSENF